MIGIGVLSLSWGTAAAEHLGDIVGIESAACGETTFTGNNGGSGIVNMYLVVHADGQTQSVNLPASPDTVSIAVGPFFTQSVETKTILWRVFGGGERNYDDPHWTGFGTTGFVAAINQYATEVGGFAWAIAGPDDPNSFTTWHELSVESCAPAGKDDCKKGGWQLYGFRNQGDCVSHFTANENSGR